MDLEMIFIIIAYTIYFISLYISCASAVEMDDKKE